MIRFLGRLRCVAGIAAAVLIFSILELACADTQGNDPAEIDHLEAKVQAAGSVRAIKRLQYTYGYYLESALWNDLADLFTEDAVVQVGAERVKGKESIRKHFTDRNGHGEPGIARERLDARLTMQPIVNLGPDGKSAKGTWHEMALLGKFGASASWQGGIYENEYVLEDNTWKISALHYVEQYQGNYDAWGHKAPPRWDVPYHFVAEDVGITIPPKALRALALTSSNQSDAERLAGLSRSISGLNDATEVQNLQHIYGYYMDRKMWDDVADLFAENGTLEIGFRGEYAGRDRIRRALELFYGPYPLREGELFDHVAASTVVTVAPDGRTARARSRELCMIGLNGEYARWETGIYENRFIKESGVWKIRAVRYYPEMITDYDKGWARDAQSAPSASGEFPPDRPSRQENGIYPKVHLVALHYENPATGQPVQYPAGIVLRSAGEAPSMKDSEAPADALIEDLERMVDAAIAVDAVENLNSSYGYYIDESAWDNMSDTFAVTGSKEITGAGVYVGRERIRTILNLRGPRGGRTPDFFTIHQLIQPVIHISEDGNSARARLRLFQCGGSADGTTGSWIGGIYENTAVKEEGEWKFGDQDLQHTFNASYRNGWARVGTAPQANARSSRPKTKRDIRGGGIRQGLGGAASPMRFMKDFPPDRPIRSKQYTFPQIVEPAFHYRNPVTGRMPPQLLP